ncbi:MAG: DeoR/GlpR transcriptional regulator [Spirochaetales bacterium]|nr:MAG: DeoR/GlpR transcriptional regulator [Spirochaetales bacterium]
MTKNESRKKKLLQVLQVRQKINVQEASELIGISPATTRRFFTQLSAEGIAVRTHGGIQLLPESSQSYSYILSTMRRIDEKARISARAVEIVSSGDLLFLDSGTTMLKMAEALELKFKTKILTDIIVVTNSLVNYEILAPYCKVILACGEVRLSRRDTFGHLAEKILESVHIHKAFFGADAVHSEKGLMATDEWTCRMNDVVSHNADSVYVLADSEKFGKSSLLSYSPLSGVNLIITDDGIGEKDLEPFREKGANIEVVALA